MSLVFPVHAESVKGIIDGDTLVLRNGEHVRLIGIDAPELGRKGKPSQSFAKKAQQHLTALIKSAGYTVSLDHDKVRRDHYGRTLAHVHTKKHGNLSSAMLESGLATLLVFPPNLKYLNRYAAAQDSARQTRIAVWAKVLSAPLLARALTKRDLGVRYVRGKVTSTRSTSKNVWIWLDNNLLLKTKKDEAMLFDQRFPDGLRGETLGVLSKLYMYKGQLRMRLRHPAQILKE